MKSIKISIIGAGSVGSTIAYALMLKNIAAQIYLIDINEIRCRGEILDLSDALSFCGPSHIKSGTTSDAQQSDIIVVAAGSRQKPGQDRRALFEQNRQIVTDIITTLQPINKNSIIIMVTNPVDSLTYVAQQLSGLPRSQVFGSGTFLDTQRLRELIATRIHIAEQSIHAYVLGEHGDTQFAAWSCARVAGMTMADFGLSETDLIHIAQKAREKAYEIIACKGATYYGIATSVAALCRTILFNQKRVTPVSCYVEEFKVCLSLPVVLARNGIEKILHLPLSSHEQKQLAHSAKVLQKMI